MDKMQKVRKVVVPVAGLGTRMLPATKSIPKEMLTIVDRPVIQYCIDEAIEAGIEHIVFVTGRNKSAIEDYFDQAPELYSTLQNGQKADSLAMLDDILPDAGLVSFTRQQSPKGLGHAIWCARNLIGNEPFAIMLPDMVSFGDTGCMAEAIELYNQTGDNVISVEECDPSETGSYGIVSPGTTFGKGFSINGMVEKPKPEDALSNYFINGRYILQPEIFEILETQKQGAGGEIQLTDAMLSLMEKENFYAQPFTGRMFDCGRREGFVEANVAFALKRADYASASKSKISQMSEHTGLR